MSRARRWIALALLLAAMVMAAALLLVSAGPLSRYASDLRPQQIFLLDTASRDDVDELAAFVRSQPYVSSVVYISKADAKARFKRDVADAPDVLRAVEGTANPLPASLEVRLKWWYPDPRKQLGAAIRAWPGVDRVVDLEIRYGKR